MSNNLDDIFLDDIRLISNDLNEFYDKLEGKPILIAGGKGFLGTYFTNVLKQINEFSKNINESSKFTKEKFEEILNQLIKKHQTNFKGVGQPMRIALIGSKFGPGIFDIILSLGKETVIKRLSKFN